MSAPHPNQELLERSPPAPGPQAADGAADAFTTSAERVFLCASPTTLRGAVTQGGSIERFVDIERLAAAMRGQPPPRGLIIVPGDGVPPAADSLSALRQATPVGDVAVVVVTPVLDIAEQIELLKLGATRLVSPETPWEMVAALALAPAQRPAENSSKVVFLFDSDEVLRLRIRADLKRHGIVGFGYEDLPSLLSGPEHDPDLIILGRDGRGSVDWDLLRRLRQRRSLRTLPVLMLLDGVDHDAQALAFQHGADDFLLLPLATEDLVARIGYQIDARRAARGVPSPAPAVPAPAVVSSPLPPIATPSSSARRHILIADDDPYVAELLKHRMKNEGWQVTATRDGEEAERLIDVGDVDVILLDLNLPHRSGFDILHALRRRSPRLSTKLVVLSSINREETVQTAFSLDADDFIPKPFNPEMVVSRIRRLLKR